MKKMIEREISYLNLQCIHEPLHNELSVSPQLRVLLQSETLHSCRA